jgi:hypothetical protein
MTASFRRVIRYFIDAVHVHVCLADPAARLAALTAGIVADGLQRSSMVTYLRGAAAVLNESGTRGGTADQLGVLADEIAQRDWTIGDIGRAKAELRKANAQYAAALDAFDSTVFRRTFPELFESVGR